MSSNIRQIPKVPDSQEDWYGARAWMLAVTEQLQVAAGLGRNIRDKRPTTGDLMDGNVTTITTQKIWLSNLPTSDPASDGQVWNDSGTLKISSG